MNYIILKHRICASREIVWNVWLWVVWNVWLAINLWIYRLIHLCVLRTNIFSYTITFSHKYLHQKVPCWAWGVVVYQIMMADPRSADRIWIWIGSIGANHMCCRSAYRSTKKINQSILPAPNWSVQNIIFELTDEIKPKKT